MLATEENISKEQKKIIDMVSIGNLEQVFIYFLQDKSNFNIRDENGNTLLHLAIKYNKYEMCLLLLQLQAVDVNALDLEGNTPLHLAVEENNEEIVKILLKVNPEGLNVNLNKLYSNLFHDRDNIIEKIMPDEIPFGKEDQERNIAVERTDKNLGKLMPELKWVTADIDIKNKVGQSPINLTGSNTVRALINNQAEINHPQQSQPRESTVFRTQQSEIKQQNEPFEDIAECLNNMGL